MTKALNLGCGARIRQLRKALELSQRQLADLAELSYVSICHYETGTTIPQRASMDRLAKALGTSAAFLREGVPAYQADPRDTQVDARRLNEAIDLSRRLIAKIAQVPHESVIVRVRPCKEHDDR